MERIRSALTAMDPVRKDHIKQDSATCTQPRGGALSLMSDTDLTGGRCLHRASGLFHFHPPNTWKGHRSGGLECIGRLKSHGVILDKFLSELGGHASHPPELLFVSPQEAA